MWNPTPVRARARSPRQVQVMEKVTETWSNVTGAVGDAVTATTDATVGAATATVGATVGAATATVDATVGAAKATGDVVGQAGTFAMDGASGGIGLVMAGVDQTFETLGGKAGFQAVMVGFGATVDTTDAGLEKLFKELDADGSGQIDESEMTKAIRKVFGEDLDAKFVSEMMTSADTNKDGEIDLEEFKTIMRAGPKEKQGTPTLKPKCILGLNGDKPSGKPNVRFKCWSNPASRFDVVDLLLPAWH